MGGPGRHGPAASNRAGDRSTGPESRSNALRDARACAGAVHTRAAARLWPLSLPLLACAAMRNRAHGAAGSRLAVGLVVAATVTASALPAAASPLEYLPVGDPLEAELRTLDLLDPSPLGGRILLPRLHTLPLQKFEFQGSGAPPALPSIYSISVARIERALARDAVPDFAQRPGLASTPRLFQSRPADDGRLEIDNNAAERALRPVALGRKNYLFAGSDAGGKRAPWHLAAD